MIVTHNMQQAARVSDTTAFMTILEAGQPGTLVETGPTSSIFDKPTQRGHGRVRLRPVRLEAMAQVEPGFLEQRLIEVSDLVRHGLRERPGALDARRLRRSPSA